MDSDDYDIKIATAAALVEQVAFALTPNERRDFFIKCAAAVEAAFIQRDRLARESRRLSDPSRN